MKRIFVTLAVLAMVCGTADAQSFLEKLGEKAKKAAEENISGKVEKGVNDVLDGKLLKNKKKDKKDDAAEKEEAAKPAEAPKPEPKKQVQTGYAKTDFVPGDEIFFDDPVEGE